MNIEDIRILIESFYNGETTAAEEEMLLSYFEGDDVAEDLLEERDVFLQLKNTEPIDIPVGLEFRLNNLIDNLAANESQKIVIRELNHSSRSLLWFKIGGIAASVAILFSIGLYVGNNSKGDAFSDIAQGVEVKDSFDDPADAYKEAERALMLVSYNLNKGVDQISVVSDNIDKTNTILDKNVNRIITKDL